MFVPDSSAAFLRALCAVLALLASGCSTVPPAEGQFVNDCDIQVAPPSVLTPWVRAELSRDTTAVTAKAAVSVSGDERIKLADFDGNWFLDVDGQPIDKALKAGSPTLLTYSWSNDQLRIDGAINGTAIQTWTLQTTGSPAAALLRRIGEDDFGPGRSRIRFFFRGFRTGFTLKDA